MIAHLIRTFIKAVFMICTLLIWHWLLMWYNHVDILKTIWLDALSANISPQIFLQSDYLSPWIIWQGQTMSAPFSKEEWEELSKGNHSGETFESTLCTLMASPQWIYSCKCLFCDTSKSRLSSVFRHLLHDKQSNPNKADGTWGKMLL